MSITLDGTNGITMPVGSQSNASCVAWVNFNGTSTTPITPRASYNVTSVTKNSTGDYTLNFTTALLDANYCAVCSARQLTSSGEVLNVQIADKPYSSICDYKEECNYKCNYK